MFDLLHPGRSLAWDLTWQATAFLAVGCVVSLMLARRPARAHQTLLFAMIAALLTPLLAQGVRQLGLGLLALSVSQTEPQTPVATAPAPPPADITPLPQSRPLTLPVGPPPAAHTPILRTADRSNAPGTIGAARIQSLALTGWAAITILASARLVLSALLGRRMVARSLSVDEPRIQSAAQQAKIRLGLRVQPELLQSDLVQCPAIWCWGRRPRLILPSSAIGDPDVDWVAVLSHELAHWGRRDHLSGLVGELLGCALPWHPLAWWARRWMSQLAEQASDDWVLASGQPAVEYAETLLDLVPQSRRSLALTAVSTRGGLIGRVQRILADVRREAGPGRRWTALALVATVLAASLTALAQTRPGDPVKKTEGKASAPEQVVMGRVSLPGGAPASGATVVWFTYESATNLHGVALPYQLRQQDELRDRLRELGRATADADGRFRIAARFDLEANPATELVIRASGAALYGRTVFKKDLGKEQVLNLAEPEKIEGRLLTPAGRPAAGVKVELADFSNGGRDDGTFEGMSARLHAPGTDRPPFWPQATVTDRDGRFVLDDIVPRGMFARLQFEHPAFALDEVTVSTGPPPTEGQRAFDIHPAPPKFTHTLEPPRPVVGTVTASDTGKPIADATVRMIPMRQHGGQNFFTTTDAAGHYRVAGHQAQFYFVSAYPPPGSPYLEVSHDRMSWPDGAKVLTVDFALDRGKLIQGRVIDAETHQPIAGASVVYQPKRGNPNNKGRHEFRNPVLTDADGRFAIVGLPGEGYLLVEEGSLKYIRTSVSSKETGLFRQTLYPHGVAKIDVPTDGELDEVEIALHQGKTLKVLALGPNGESLPSVNAWCPELTYRQLQNWTIPHEFENGLFELQGADPERTYRVFFYSKERRLGLVTKLKLDPSATRPIEVRLQPMATVKGVAVNNDGTPAQGVQVSPMVVLTEDPKPLKDDELYENDKADFYSNLSREGFATPTTPAQFQYNNLIPGLRYYITIWRSGRTIREVPAPRPGEVIDLGSIVVEDKP